VVCWFVCLAGIAATGAAAQESEVYGSRYEDLIPRPLMGLLHAPEVHTELQLTAQQISSLEAMFVEVDAAWFPARILPPAEYHTTIRKLEQTVWDWFHRNTSPAQQRRLKQLEFYGQGTRTLLRKDIAEKVGLSSEQQAKIAELAKATDSAQLKLSQAKYGDPEIENLQTTLAQCMAAERSVLSGLVNPQQRQKLTVLLGPTFDPSKLKRIYALAPQFQAVDHWINSPPLQMRDLRGQVVLVHFYAFQCHNCHANFGIYQRWHRELTDRGVVVIGVQTPETSRERDPEAVKSAAVQRELNFPILIDLDSANWRRWGNTMWPTVYVVDRQGYIRHWWQGELNWKGATGDETIERLVDELLAEDH
jgi:peroxiredoxin